MRDSARLCKSSQRRAPRPPLRVVCCEQRAVCAPCDARAGAGVCASAVAALVSAHARRAATEPASLRSVGACSTMLNAASRAGAAARSSAPPTPPTSVGGAAQLQSAGVSLDAVAEFTSALPRLRRARRARCPSLLLAWRASCAAGDGGEDAGATLGDATGAARGSEQALQGAPDSTNAAPATTLELPVAGGGGGGRRRHAAVPMPPGAQRYKGVSWNKSSGTWQAAHVANGMCMCKAFPADQAAAAARF
jgi:hypothetical protein